MGPRYGSIGPFGITALAFDFLMVCVLSFGRFFFVVHVHNPHHTSYSLNSLKGIM